MFRDRVSGNDYIATSYIDIVKTSRPGSDQSEEDGLCIFSYSFVFSHLVQFLVVLLHIDIKYALF